MMKILTEEHKRKIAKAMAGNRNGANNSLALKAYFIKSRGKFYNREFLYSKYWNENKSISQISKIISVSPDTLTNWFRYLGIPKRSVSEGKKLYRFSDTHLANVKKARQEAGMIHRGKNHWNWQGGKSLFDIRNKSRKEYKTFRKLVLERDNYVCQACKKENSNQVHHILPVYKFPHLIYCVEKAITLCTECHNKTMGREHLFIAIFEKLVNSEKPKAKAMETPNQACEFIRKACVETNVTNPERDDIVRA